METVKLYCPKCQDIYVHPSHAAQRKSVVDKEGSAARFGTGRVRAFMKSRRRELWQGVRGRSIERRASDVMPTEPISSPFLTPTCTMTGVDGAYFGTTFPHLFFMTYGSMIPDPPEQKFVPRVFGFRVHRSAVNGALARGHAQGAQQHDRQLDERRRHLRGAGAAAGEGAVVVAARGSQATGGGNAGTRRKPGDRGVEEAEDDEEEDCRAKEKAAAKGDSKRSGDRILVLGAGAAGGAGEKGKEKGSQADVGKGTGGASRGRGGVENGRTPRWVLRLVC